MPFAIWKEEYSVGVSLIDGQHQKFFEIINRIHGVRLKEREETYKIIEELKEYAQYHFSFEEKYMINSHYPDYEAHRQQHKYYIAQIELFKYKNFKDDYQGILNFMRDWLVNHILKIDKGMYKFFESKGVELSED